MQNERELPPVVCGIRVQAVITTIAGPNIDAQAPSPHQWKAGSHDPHSDGRDQCAALLRGSEYDGIPAERIVFAFAPISESTRVVAAGMFVTTLFRLLNASPRVEGPDISPAPGLDHHRCEAVQDSLAN